MTTLVYPHLGAVRDLGFVRVSGVGLGNAFFNYFHAVRVAEEAGAQVIAPAWPSVKIGTYLRRERSKRSYLGQFSRYPDEIGGVAKFSALATRWLSFKRVAVDPNSSPKLQSGNVNVLAATKYEFGKLKDRRDLVRERLIRITSPGAEPHWGKANYVAVHVRLGDFSIGSVEEIAAGKANTRIPLGWYEAVTARVREALPGTPILIFSDGPDHELTPLLDAGCQRAPSGSDIEELLSLASASFLIGSRSTYSRWAAFLGNMPSVWLGSESDPEQPSDSSVPISYIDLHGQGQMTGLDRL